ncbi:FAD-dependent oxidoreductase [Leucobacter luti]|uniref:Isorenieratene synthase n=1 Tax=Leucobacter luti TaxID=340320 RepID=A0A4V2FMY9_9MICO|nr:FAD-dependent oxidoreductase [Leucobacter luti]MBL3699665.1 FAD-dependent oxidoreductase [Leucobacter luti]RZT59439.1 isorenieratene synthase [Leucobacter luti]
MPQRASIRDTRAHEIPAHPGTPRVTRPRRVVVVGGGIAGLAAACGLAERGVEVTLIEAEDRLGGRVRSWETTTAAGDVTMSRGFHAFFRQYYNLRELLARAGDLDAMLSPIADYPVVSARGDADSFAKIPRTPPWNFMTFVARSPTFRARDLARVDIDTALSLLDVDFPETFRELDGVSAAEFLDRLRFPERARHLALEVFARSFFADPSDFSAGELVAMFHAYFLGSAEGLLFDVPRDDFDTSLWAPLGQALEASGVRRVTGTVTRVERGQTGSPAHSGSASRPGSAAPSGAATSPGSATPPGSATSAGAGAQPGPEWRVVTADGACETADAVVLAAGPGATREIVAASPGIGSEEWRKSIDRIELAPPFAVLRLWFDGPVQPDRAPFLGTAGFGPLDNVSVLERFEAGAAEWSREHGGSVVELHAYAIDAAHLDDPAQQRELAAQLRRELERVYPETAGLTAVSEILLIERDCALIGTDSWDGRPRVRTPVPGLALAGDWVRSDLPIALMERAATTGWMAANELLRDWGAAGHTLWSVPTRGRHRWPRVSRALMARLPGR